MWDICTYILALIVGHPAQTWIINWAHGETPASLLTDELLLTDENLVLRAFSLNV